MNLVHRGNLTTSLLADQPRSQRHLEATTTHLVLIPSYNTGARLFPTVATIRRQNWPVCVVIDGSTDGTGQELARIAANDPDLRVLVLPLFCRVCDWPMHMLTRTS
jgi:cellulose synthase/poly-beta-1,6-N-acetylglucosamine synthase-like glycosyltransferase